MKANTLNNTLLTIIVVCLGVCVSRVQTTGLYQDVNAKSNVVDNTALFDSSGRALPSLDAHY